MADVFHTICRIAMNPYVLFSKETCYSDWGVNLFMYSHSAIPGGADRAMTSAARLKMYFTLTAILGGCTAVLVVLFRNMRTPLGLGSWSTSWAHWLLGGSGTRR